MFTKQHRLPYEPLARFIDENTANMRQVAEAIGVARRTVELWSSGGGIPEQAADKAAIRLGVHPSAIWGDDWFRLAQLV
jgi:hypothetical protein